MRLKMPYYFYVRSNQLFRVTFKATSTHCLGSRSFFNNSNNNGNFLIASGVNFCGNQSLQLLNRISQYFRKPINRTISSASVLHADAEMVDVTFITSDGAKHKTKGKVGDNLLDVVVNNNVDLDGFGACEGTLACSTCHLVFKKADFDKIKDKITDEELDMLDLAYGLCDTSRLGCQVTLTKELAGVEVEVPAGVNDARS